jgi:hypothetical protein
MPLINYLPDEVTTPAVTLPEAIQEPSKSIFTSLVPESRIASLLKYAEGYPWTVNYYGQILNTNNTLENFDPTALNLTQPYYKVNGLILQVSSVLSSNYDANTGITIVTGSAIAPYSVTPNVGDVFLASIDNGEDAIFLINNVIRKTYRKDTLYEISYNLYAYHSVNPTFIQTIETSVQDSYYFNKDSNFFNRDLLIKPDVKEYIDKLKSFLIDSKHYYFKTFAQKEVGTILIPGITNKVYDPLLLNFISRIVDYSELIDIPFFRHNYNQNKYINQSSIYDLLLSRNAALVSTVNKQYKFVSSSLLPNRARLGTIFHTGVNYVLYPINPDLSTDITALDLNPDNSAFLSTVKSSKNYSYTDKNIQTINNEIIFEKKLLPDLFVDDYYVVTESFYEYINNSSAYENISYTEFIIANFIKKKAISKKDLLIAVQDWPNWSTLHKLYLLPVFWLVVSTEVY